MPWTPTTSLLGTHAELETFSHSIQYYTETAGAPDPISGLPGPAVQTYYQVKVTPLESNPSTVTFTAGNPGIIGGYYKGIFNDSLKTRDFKNNFTTVTTLTGSAGGVFDKVDRSNVHEVIAFHPDMTRSRTFSYLAEAYSAGTPNTIVASMTYTVLAQDLNWSPGMMNLKELVSYASSK